MTNAYRQQLLKFFGKISAIFYAISNDSLTSKEDNLPAHWCRCPPAVWLCTSLHRHEPHQTPDASSAPTQPPCRQIPTSARH